MRVEIRVGAAALSTGKKETAWISDVENPPPEKVYRIDPDSTKVIPLAGGEGTFYVLKIEVAP